MLFFRFKNFSIDKDTILPKPKRVYLLGYLSSILLFFETKICLFLGWVRKGLPTTIVRSYKKKENLCVVCCQFDLFWTHSTLLIPSTICVTGVGHDVGLFCSIIVSNPGGRRLLFTSRWYLLRSSSIHLSRYSFIHRYISLLLLHFPTTSCSSGHASSSIITHHHLLLEESPPEAASTANNSCKGSNDDIIRSS